jgi:hypothetical protein
MDTKEAAEALGTTPRELRAFLRSEFSTFVPVGSGSRYDFNDKDIVTLGKRFPEWKGAGKPNSKKTGSTTTTTTRSSSAKRENQRRKDSVVWAEESPVVLEDIRNPRVRARVMADAKAAEDRLELRLLAAGLHITQLGNRS